MKRDRAQPAEPSASRRGLLRTGGSGVLLVAIMVGGGLVLWVGVPLGWLYVGSLVQGSTDSLSIALLVMMVGVVVSIAVLAWREAWTTTARPPWRA